jgi:hypothetical protein
MTHLACCAVLHTRRICLQCMAYHSHVLCFADGRTWHCCCWWCLLQSLPNEVLFSHLLDAAQIPSLWLPAEPTDVVEPEPLR